MELAWCSQLGEVGDARCLGTRVRIWARKRLRLAHTSTSEGISIWIPAAFSSRICVRYVGESPLESALTAASNSLLVTLRVSPSEKEFPCTGPGSTPCKAS